jgi:aspartyl/asparaginyl beta-hydroxylase (cupin superfamily)
MSQSIEDAQSLITRAKSARQDGQPDEAVAILKRLLADRPDVGPAWNLLGVIHLESGRLSEAVQSLRRVVEVDPDAPFGWFNLAKAQRSLGDLTAELQSLDAALDRDAYFLPALLAKGETLRTLGRAPEAVELYRLLLGGLDDTSSFPPAIQAQIQEAREYLGRQGAEQLGCFEKALAETAKRFPEADLARARAFAANRAGVRKIYHQQPIGGHFPFLPALEFFDRKYFPWFESLEKRTEDIRSELVSLWAEENPDFRPYVARPPGTPLSQWQELNNSPRWSAFFFWEDGKRNDANCERCPNTAAAIESLPMLDIPGKGPTAMFSLLKPHTHIPAHTGTTNARTTVHLGLVIPPDCRFRVGADIREWREGECWAFDDTIEHEAWNDSDSARAILILDTWNPLLTDVEREVVRAIG